MSPGRNWREVKAEAHRLYPEMADPQRQAVADAQLDAYVSEHHLKELRKSVDRGLSAHVAEALRFKHDRDRLLELMNWLEEEYGPVTDDERVAASEELEDLDAEHERRRAGGKANAGEAA